MLTDPFGFYPDVEVLDGLVEVGQCPRAVIDALAVSKDEQALVLLDQREFDRLAAGT
jgi:hypothetical protein